MTTVIIYYAIAFEPYPELRWFLDKDSAKKYADSHPERAEFFDYYHIETFIGSDVYLKAKQKTITVYE